MEGAVTLERSAWIQGDIVNNGTLSIRSSATTLATETASGTGNVEIGSTAGSRPARRIYGEAMRET